MRLTLFATLFLVASVITFSFMRVNAAESDPVATIMFNSDGLKMALADHCCDSSDVKFVGADSLSF